MKRRPKRSRMKVRHTPIMATHLPEAPMNDWPLWRALVTYDGYVIPGPWQPTPRDPNTERKYVRTRWDEVVFVGAVCEADARWTLSELTSFAGNAMVIHSLTNVPADWVEGDAPLPEAYATHYTCDGKTCYNGHDVDNCWGREDEVCLGSGDKGIMLQGTCDHCCRYFEDSITADGITIIPAHYAPKGE